MERRDKINYYLDLAKMVAQRSTCLRRHYGAVIVKNDEVISTGYVGAPRGRKNCTDLGECIRIKMEIPRGERYELCRSVHAEANAITKVARSNNSSRARLPSSNSGLRRGEPIRFVSMPRTSVIRLREIRFMAMRRRTDICGCVRNGPSCTPLNFHFLTL